MKPNLGPMRGVAWAPDGHTFAAGGLEDIGIWDADNPAFQGRWRGHTAQIFGMSWSPDGSRLASASIDGSLRLWERGRVEAVSVLRDQDGSRPVSVSWSPDSSRIATGSFDGPLLVWDASTGARLASWSGPPKVAQGLGGKYPFAVWGVAWSPNGKTILSTRYDGYIIHWDAASGRAITTQRKTDSQPNTIAWSPDGATFATADDRGTVELWRPDNASRVGAFENNADGWGYGLAWSPDGSLIAVSLADGSVQLWSVADGQRLASLTKHLDSAWGLAWAPNDLRLLSAADDGSLALWGI